MSDTLERYQKLRLRESLSRVYDYPSVCNELSFILRGVYAKVSKNIQSIIFEDTLSAIRLLPQVHTCRGKVAANLLLQAAEAVLPKQKRTSAVAEFKHAVVEYKRRCKGQKNEEGSAESAQLPQDVLIHLFSFLDMQSLVTVGLVCWSWSFAANENHLWKLQYATYFRSSDDHSKQIGKLAVDWSTASYKMEASDCLKTVYDWKKAFKISYVEKFPSKILSNRGYCGHCKSIVWLSNMKCTNVHHAVILEGQQTKLISSPQVVEYLLKDSLSTCSSSDSENDSDGDSVSKLWAYQKYRKHIGSSRKKSFDG
ncbi:hypothetical protein C5167_015322 [Papaver somniferum]|uniref:F-box domain-containing protein n=1 Tax=Papaver somniferum TaxID=3469 RepID=A0A4Y7J9R9_PAPSO|nr:F-box protein At5g52880-like [Papaver somniferum]RZC56469.1 hypothetical protein C5167_015322 [Papaver somniferum]